MRKFAGLAAIILVLIVGCSVGNPLVGTWKLTSSDLNATFAFKAGTLKTGQSESDDLRGMEALNKTLHAIGLKYTSTATKATDEYKKDKQDYLSSIKDSPTKVALIGVDRWGETINTEGAYEIIGGKLLIWFGEEAEYRTWWVTFSIDGKTMTWTSDKETLTLLKE